MGTTPFSASPSRSSSAQASAFQVLQPPPLPAKPHLSTVGTLPILDPTLGPRKLFCLSPLPQLRIQPAQRTQALDQEDPGDPAPSPFPAPPPAARAAPPLLQTRELRTEETGQRGEGSKPSQLCPFVPRGREIVFLANCWGGGELIGKIKGDRRKVTVGLFRRGTEERNRCESPWGLPGPSIHRLPSCCSYFC